MAFIPPLEDAPNISSGEILGARMYGEKGRR
jgi:hypothetical protein